MISKLLSIKTPRTVPPKSESRTSLVYSANAMAKREGIKERAESSIIKTQ